MKTNHRRGFQAGTHRDKAMTGYSAKLPLSGESISASVTNDFADGNRGMAKAIRGAKKFIRSRTRFHENRAVEKLARESD